ncbi:Uncharacterised protein [Pragia fontium]|uniref:hypothetical protein n=1 Tax=Pragia fontium TaxID=82985 RepID=UPI000DF8D657|nr:hypothetical protein [Pragia fontium]SUB83277.1 Uncharacterised protein [Pragia fontium]
MSNHDERINTDNFLFHSMLELGLLGGTLFILFISSQFRIFYVVSKGKRKFFLSLLMLFVISALFSSSLQSGILSVVFWLVCLIIAIDSYIVKMNVFSGGAMLNKNILWFHGNDDFKNN